ncbi:hypothetical protein F5Y16DRAFT_411530 [Xylariaceae sp. FL0255]|nr:hypothetical protein F5Y16DRAFT_411530 [Xylariaceae sp. FL0255]
MTSPILPNASNFLGVALVVNRSRDGPRFVFHYPAQITTDSNKKNNDSKAASNGAPSSSSLLATAGIDELDDDDEALLLNELTRQPASAFDSSSSAAGLLKSWDHDSHIETESGSQIVPWEHVAGYPTRDLESLLRPSRAFHKRLFQVSLDQLVFVSCPVYVPENGVWRKKKRQPKNPPPPVPAKSPENEESINKENNGQNAASGGDASQTEGKDTADDSVAAGSNSNNNNSNSNGGNGPEEVAEEKKSGMTMFNLVFILKPRKHEARELAETLYTHIMKKINKAFKYSQQKSDFVWKESKRILTLKDKNRETKTRMSVLWKEILDVSSLAACMQDIYDAVSQNKIAALQLETAEGTITHSVQIPVPFYLTDLPPEEEAALTRGLWITTANYFVEEESLHDPSFLDKNFGLLLMSDEKKIIAELQADADADEATTAMIQFVRLCKPTMSFQQISQSSGLSPAQVRKYAQHFIFWRRGIAIPPLHARDVYILSPNADLSRLPRASQAWSRAFPLAPHLADFLSELSAAPRPYKYFCPSKNHRPTYLQMLAWLMRGGWVTQLCTFAYVVVWPEIIYEVEYEIEAEELRAMQAAEASKREREQQQQQDRNEREKAKDHQQLHDYDVHDEDRGGGGGTGSDHRRIQQPPSPAGSSSTARGGVPHSTVPSRSASSVALDLSVSAASMASVSGPGSGSGTTGSSTLLAPRPSISSLTDTIAHTQPPHYRPSSSSPANTNNPQSPPPPVQTTTGTATEATSSPTFSNSASPPPPFSPVPITPQTPGERFALAARLSRIADKEAQAAYDLRASFQRKVPPQPPTSHPSTNKAPHLAHLSPHIIVDPSRASGRESLYLQAIGRRFTDPRVKAAWPVLWKHFNGRAALERVALSTTPNTGGGFGEGVGLGTGGGGGGTGDGANATGTTAGGSAGAGLSGGGIGAGGVGGVGIGKLGERADGKVKVTKKRKEAWLLMMGMREYLVCVRHW